MDAEMEFEVAIKIFLSFLVGALIGFEREYHGKAAGLRTMIMICLGSTIFTQISLSIGDSSPDRIASNIITGIGFLGAGVIFKDGLTISGITTATTIWISAALGMAIGSGEYFIALLGSVIVLVILSALQPITQKIEQFHQARSYKITFIGSDTFTAQFEGQLKDLQLRFQKKKDFKEQDFSIVLYEVYGGEMKLELLNEFLKKNDRVKAYEY
jgi:putative Mg2+ transporter-C (MgtC) family protein